MSSYLHSHKRLSSLYKYYTLYGVHLSLGVLLVSLSLSVVAGLVELVTKGILGSSSTAIEVSCFGSLR